MDWNGHLYSRYLEHSCFHPVHCTCSSCNLASACCWSSTNSDYTQLVRIRCSLPGDGACQSNPRNRFGQVQVQPLGNSIHFLTNCDSATRGCPCSFGNDCVHSIPEWWRKWWRVWYVGTLPPSFSWSRNSGLDCQTILSWWASSRHRWCSLWHTRLVWGKWPTHKLQRTFPLLNTFHNCDYTKSVLFSTS